MNKTYGWFSLAMVAFTAVFGFSNIPLNYAENGLSFVPLIIFITFAFFLPLVLMMGEMAIFNKDKSGGLYSWVETSMGKGWAFVVAWSFFIANIFYIPMLAGRVPVFLSYAFYGENRIGTNRFSSAVLAALIILIATLLVQYGPKLLEKLADGAGTIQLGVVFLFLIAVVAIPFLTNSEPKVNVYEAKNYAINFNPAFFGSFAWLLFAVAGAETIGPLVKNTHNPKKNFVKALLIASIVIGTFYALGAVAISTFVDRTLLLGLDSADAFMKTFDVLFNVYNLSQIFTTIIAIIYAFITLVALLAWANANVQTLFSEIKDGSFPKKLTKLNENGIAVNGLYVQLILALLLILLQAGFIKEGESLYFLMYDMSTMALILPYIVLVIAFVFYRIKGIHSEFKMVKNNTIAYIIAAFVLFLNVFALIFGGYDPSIKLADQIDTLFLYYGGLTIFILLGLLVRYISMKYTKNAK